MGQSYKSNIECRKYKQVEERAKKPWYMAPIAEQ